MDVSLIKYVFNINSYVAVWEAFSNSLFFYNYLPHRAI